MTQFAFYLAGASAALCLACCTKEISDAQSAGLFFLMHALLLGAGLWNRRLEANQIAEPRG